MFYLFIHIKCALQYSYIFKIIFSRHLYFSQWWKSWSQNKKKNMKSQIFAYIFNMKNYLKTGLKMTKLPEFRLPEDFHHLWNYMHAFIIMSYNGFKVTRYWQPLTKKWQWMCCEGWKDKMINIKWYLFVMFYYSISNNLTKCSTEILHEHKSLMLSFSLIICTVLQSSIYNKLQFCERKVSPLI